MVKNKKLFTGFYFLKYCIMKLYGELFNKTFLIEVYMSAILRTGHVPFSSKVPPTPNSSHSVKSIIQDKINTIKQTDNAKYQNLQKLYIEIKTNGLMVNPESVSQKMESIISCTSDEIKVFIKMCLEGQVKIKLSEVCIYEQHITGNYNNGDFASARFINCNFSE